MIENEEELRYSVQALGKNYDLAKRIAAETIGDPRTRESEVEGVEAMIRKIERQVAEYLAAKYGFSQVAQEKAA